MGIHHQRLYLPSSLWGDGMHHAPDRFGSGARRAAGQSDGCTFGPRPSTVSLILILILTNAARPERRHSFVVPSLHSHGLDPLSLSLASVIVLSRQMEHSLSRFSGSHSPLDSVHHLYLLNFRHFISSIFDNTQRRKCPKDHVLLTSTCFGSGSGSQLSRSQ